MNISISRPKGLLLAFAVAIAAAASAWGILHRSETLALAPSQIEFGDLLVGRSADQFVLVTNLGAEPIALDRIEVPAPFSVVTTPLELGPGESGSLTVRFSPLDRGAVDAELEISGKGASASVEVTGRGVGIPEFVLEPESISFGEVAIGSVGTAALTIRNSGIDVLELDDWRVPSPFELAQPLERVEPGQTASAELRFHPTRARSFEGRLSVSSNDPGRATLAVTLSGSGVEGAIAPALTVSPAELDFGAVPVGAERKGWLTLRNNGEHTLTLASLNASSGFSAPARSRHLAPGGSISFPVVFKPTEQGTRSGSLTIHSNAAGGTMQVSLQGEGSSWDDPRVTAALTGPGSQALTAIGEVPRAGTFSSAGAGSSHSGGSDVAGSGGAAAAPGETPAGGAPAPESPVLLEGSEVGLAYFKTPVEEASVGALHFDANSGALSLDDIQLPGVSMALGGYYEFAPTDAVGRVNELGDIELEMPIVVIDRHGNENHVMAQLTTGTSTGYRRGYPFSLTGEPLGPDGTATLVAVGSLPHADGRVPLGNDIFTARFKIRVQ